MNHAGYDGMEINVEDLHARYFGSETVEEAMVGIRAALRRHKVPLVGGLYHIKDHDWDDSDFLETHRKVLLRNKSVGHEYATYQIHLPGRYKNSGGDYRDDDAFLRLCASRINALHRVCEDVGMNFYVETHVDRITEDVWATQKLLDLAEPFEINGDLSHYIIKGVLRGEALDRVREQVNHAHIRMARIYGDLSVEVREYAAEGSAPRNLLTSALFSM